GFAVKEAIGTGFDLEAVAALGPGIAARASGLFEDGDFSLRYKLLQTKGGGQSRNAGADNYDALHAGFSHSKNMATGTFPAFRKPGFEWSTSEVAETSS